MKHEDLVVYVDIDDTLMRSVGTTRVPIPAAVAHVKDLHGAGATLYCWSAGGAAYAESTAVELHLEDLFAAFLPKPHVMIDDRDPAEWPHLVVAGPLGLASTSVGDHVAALLARRRSGPVT